MTASFISVRRHFSAIAPMDMCSHAPQEAAVRRHRRGLIPVRISRYHEEYRRYVARQTDYRHDNRHAEATFAVMFAFSQPGSRSIRLPRTDYASYRADAIRRRLATAPSLQGIDTADTSDVR